MSSQFLSVLVIYTICMNRVTVFIWYLIKSDLPSIHMYRSVQVTFYKVPETHGHV